MRTELVEVPNAPFDWLRAHIDRLRAHIDRLSAHIDGLRAYIDGPGGLEAAARTDSADRLQDHQASTSRPR